jgi:hypothetical protein
MNRILKWLAKVYCKVIARLRRTHVTIIEVAAKPNYTHGDLMSIVRKCVRIAGEAATNAALAPFGAYAQRIGLVPETQLAEAIQAIQQTIIHAEYEARIKHTRKVDGRHVGEVTLYELVMRDWEDQALFESKTVMERLVKLGYAATSHGPTLSDLTHLGYLDSLGEGWYGFTHKSPVGVDWAEERKRLLAERSARLAA